MTTIEIPSSVTSIGDDAFDGCSSLTSIEIPSSVTSIGKYAFNGCIGLTSIVVDTNNPNFDSRNNCNAIINSTTNELIVGCNHTIIPSSVTSIRYDAFDFCSGLISIVVDSNNPNYDSRNNCNAIINSTTNDLIVGSNNTIIPSSVTSIYRDAFNGRKQLTTITIPSAVTYIEGSAFDGCSSLQCVTLPISLFNISDGIFSHCI